MLVVLLIVGCLVLSTQAQFLFSCPDTSGIFTPCVIREDSCFSDFDCPQGRMCCPYGCGRTCQIPRILNVIDIGCRETTGGSKRFCIHSGMCPIDENCCNFRYHEPVFTIG